LQNTAGRDAELAKIVRRYFVSGNGVPVTRVVLQRKTIEHFLSPETPND